MVRKFNTKETLIERLESILRFEQINPSKLIRGEAEYFWDQHSEHGKYHIELEYDDYAGHRLQAMVLKCQGDINFNTECPHQSEKTVPELNFSLVYSLIHLGEIAIQRRRREGKNYEFLLLNR